MLEEDLSFFEIHSNDCPNPCCYIDAKTYELLYINHAMSKLTHNVFNYRHKPCYEVIHKLNSPCEHCILLESSDRKFNEVKIQSEINGKMYRVQSRLFHIDGKEIYYCKYFNERKNDYTLTYSGNLPTGMSIDEAMADCANIISNTNSDHTYKDYLEVLGKYYNSDNVAILNLDILQKTISLKTAWRRAENFSNLLDFQNNEKVIFLKEMIDSYEVMGISIFENLKLSETENPKLKNFFIKYNLDNVVISTLKDDSNIVTGFIALFNVKSDIQEFRLFTSVTKFIQDSIITENKELKINAILDIDTLTGFFNSNKYVADTQELEKNFTGSIGVIFASINGLGRTNEYFGYEAGDSKIQQASFMLRELYYESWYRISGSEFICFVKDCTESDFYFTVDNFVKKSNSTNNTILTLGHIWSPKSNKIANLVSEADAIMYINKQAFYSNDNNKYKEITNKLLQDLLLGIKNDEFLVYLQPKVNLKNGKIKGAEALIRRFDNSLNKMIFPDNFIPKYEKNSIIRHIDIYVLETVCKLLKNWKNIDDDFTISVNLSRVTLLENDIVSTFSRICDKYGIDHKHIVVELTERVGIVENHIPSTLVTQFQEHNFKLSLDDFGCAYSNIVTLVDVPFDEVKLDKSLIDHILTNKRNNIVIESIVSAINKMDSNTTTLAEGIETAEQANCLKDFGCQYGQGYYYSKPISSDDFYNKYLK